MLAEPTTYQEIYERAKAVRRRLGLLPNPVIVTRPRAIAAPVTARRPKPASPSRLHHPAAAAIIEQEAERAGLFVADILGRDRPPEITEARHRAYAAVSDAHPELSLIEIGRIFDRDHTTILHGLRKVGAWPRRPRR